MDINAELQELLKLAGMGDQPVTPENVRAALEKLKMLIRQLSQQQHAAAATPPAGTGGGSGGGSKGSEIGALSGQSMSMGRKIMVVGQLGIVTHQLKQTLMKLGAEVDVAHDANEAITMYQKQDYSTVIMDLFLPTEREGFMVLDEIKRLSLLCNISTNIVVLATASKDKNLKDICRQRGAAVFLNKAEGWHKKVIELFSDPEKAASDDD